MYSQSLKKKVEKGGLFDIKVILKSFFEKPNSNFFTIQGTSVGKNSKYLVAHKHEAHCDMGTVPICANVFGAS